MKITKGRYHTDNSWLIINILRIYHETHEYVKCKMALSSTGDKRVIEVKTYKLYKNRIMHWKKYSL